MARVGGQLITVEEFKTRFALTPYFGQFPDDPQVKLLALSSLIGEKLLSQKAQEGQLHSTDKFQAFSRQMEKEALIEGVLHDLFSGIEISNEELKTAHKNSQRALQVEEWVFATAEQARTARVNLLNQKNQSNSDLPESRIYRVKWGDSDYEIEDILWKLKTGEISELVPFQNHFYLFRIAGDFQNEQIPPFQQARPQIQRMLEKRKKEQIYRYFFKKLMVGKKTHVPPEILNYIAQQMELALDLHAASLEDSLKLNPKLLSEMDYLRVAQKLDQRLQENFVTFDDGSVWTIGDFLRNLRYGPYPLNYSSRGTFRASLHKMAVMMMEQEYVAKEGLRRGLQKSLAVKREAQIWKDSFLADQMRLQIIRSNPKNEQHRSSASNQAMTAGGMGLERLDRFLTDALQSRPVQVNRSLLDSLQVKSLQVVAFKRHFPGRKAAPDLLPLDQLQSYFSEFYKLVK